jgi:hypothetical protein
MAFIEPVLAAVFPTSYYPRLVYNGITLDFEIAKMVAVQETPVCAQNTTLSGVVETLGIRLETTVVLSFAPMSSPKLQELRAYWLNWAWLGKQAVLTLDRFGTCAGHTEYDLYNLFFTKAELLNSPFGPTRFTPKKALYSIDLTFRQGQ